MSIGDDRPGRAGDYSNTGYNRGAETYPGSGYSAVPERNDPGFVGLDDNQYSTDQSDQPTTLLPGPGASPYEPFAEEPPLERPKPSWHGGADLGLLVLRIVLGGSFVAHGLRTLFGFFGGGGIDDAKQTLAELGFSNTTTLAWVTGVTELTGGTLVLLGLFTPAGAAALVGLMASTIIPEFDAERFLGGVEQQSIYAAAAFAILFAGPGRVSLDRPTPWYRHVVTFGIVFLIIAAGASATMLLVFR